MSFDAVTLQHRLTFGAEHLLDPRGMVATADELYVSLMGNTVYALHWGASAF